MQELGDGVSRVLLFGQDVDFFATLAVVLYM